MEITKEKLICALKSNLAQINKEYYYGSSYSAELRLKAGDSYIRVYSERKLKRETIETEVNVKPKYFWQKTEKKVIEKGTLVYDGYKYFISYGKQFEITEEEYNDLLDSYRDYQKQKDYNTIDELCKTTKN